MEKGPATRVKKRNLALKGFILLIVISINGTASLKCYSCSNSTNLHDCDAIDTCDEGQVCYKKREFTTQVQFNMGCIDKKSCGEFAEKVNTSEIAKMNAVTTRYCFECCSKNKCNGDLCEYPPHTLCKDDDSVDCARLNSMFSICKITSEAKKICPRYCELCDLVDGNWSPWSLWSSCDVTCGIGLLSRHRSCTNPAPKNGGLECLGQGTEKKTCKLKLCPVHGGWSSWENWGKCSANCGVGMRSRKRSCTNPHPERFGDHCFGDGTDYELCNNESCSVNGGWSNWLNWGQCSTSCGVGLQTRTRSCTTPANYAYQCTGHNIENRLCYLELCAGMWTDWQAWGECNVKCGQGAQTRKRTCLKQLFSGDCEGNATEIKTCKTPCTDCSDVKQYLEKQESGVTNVKLWKTGRVIPVFCDLDTDGGGWTVFQYRFNGSVDFYRNFSDYENGFGSLNGEFWLGLKFIFEMVSQGKTQLRLDLTASDMTTFQEVFQNFRLGDGPYYTLYIDPKSGTSGLHGLQYHNGRHFTTYDADRDTLSTNCAVHNYGGWWYKSCSYANLNGPYITPGTQRRDYLQRVMFYYSFKEYTSLKVSKMMFRRI